MSLNSHALPDAAQQALRDIAPEVIATLLAEWYDIMQGLDDHIAQWLKNPHEETEHRARLMRLLHTLKGSVRVAGLLATGEIVHDLEQLLDQADYGQPNAAFIRTYQALQTHMHALCSYAKTLPIAEHKQPEPSTDKIPTDHIPASVRHATPVKKTEADRQPEHALTIKVPTVFLEDMLSLASEVAALGNQLAQYLYSDQQQFHEIHHTLEQISDIVQTLTLDAHNEPAQSADPIDLFALDPVEDTKPSLANLQKQLRHLQRQHETRYQQQCKTSHTFHAQTQYHQAMQQKLLQTRMIPTHHLLEKLQPMVQQTAAELGKSVTFDLLQEEELIDRMVMEKMSAPLEHMLRNAVGHGIEVPEQRSLHNKSQQGIVRLCIQRTPSHWIFQVQDDGAGLCPLKLEEQGRQQGLIDHSKPLTDAQLQTLVTTPGFSTAQPITALSGRGIGMDVVNRAVTDLGGHMRVHSTPGQGSCFTLYLPVTFVLSTIMPLRVGCRQYAFLSSVIDTLITLPVSELGQNNHQLTHAGATYSVLWVEQLLDLARETGKRATVTLILLTQDQHKMAFVVDEVMPHQSVIIKPAGSQLMGKSGIAGGAVLDDGQPVIVLDLMLLAQLRFTDEPTTEIDTPPLIMIADDSAVVRSLTRAVLIKAGYRVIEAENGEEAIQLIEHHHPDVLLLDVEMPKKDGFEVLHWVRHQEAYQELSVIMISARIEAEHQKTAEKMGVCHFMSKPFDRECLLHCIDAELRTGSKRVKSHA